ncbi:MAG: hypothetical protein S4CHLAM7_06960 [Chlamydiae bacterium]|nr:hypothetical protein [Chlamydiota bacterium]
MVNKLRFIFLFLFIPFFLNGVDLKVEIDSDLASEEQPITGKIIVVHSDKESVDEDSFVCDQDKLKVQLISEGKQTAVSIVNGRRSESHKVISCYCFETPGKKQGTYKLPPISVKVGSKMYQSSSTAYQVYGTEMRAGFHLDREIQGPKVLYPGQRLKACYRLSLQSLIEPTQDYLPLLCPEGFSKVGERKVRQYRRGSSIVYEFSQELEAKSPGSYEIEGSFIEGLAYQEDFFSRRVYKKPKLRATAEPLTITVASFPIENCPNSFNGAIGNFHMKVEIVSDQEVCVGDKLELKIAFSGEEIDSLKLPVFSKQKQIKENFRLSDLPPAGKKEGGQKIFKFDLRPMKEGIEEIPPLEFSFFDPDTEEYKIIKSESIPIHVIGLPSASHESIEISDPIVPLAEAFPPEPAREIIEDKKPALIDIAGVFPLSSIESQDARSRFSMRPQFFIFLLVGLVIQLLAKRFIVKKVRHPSLLILQEAFKYKDQLQKYHLLLEKAFQMRLKERGLATTDRSLDQLPSHGVIREIQLFLTQIQDQLFSGQKTFDFEKSQKAAEALFKQIGER